METDDLLLFVRVAELRSLTAAGRDLRLTPAVVSSRLIGQDVPKAAAAPRGLRLICEIENERRSRSLQSP